MDDLAIYRVCTLSLSLSLYELLLLLLAVGIWIWFNRRMYEWMKAVVYGRMDWRQAKIFMKITVNHKRNEAKWAEYDQPAEKKKRRDYRSMEKKLSKKVQTMYAAWCICDSVVCMNEKFFLFWYYEKYDAKKNYVSETKATKEWKKKDAHTHKKCENTPARTPYVRCGTTLSHFKPVIFHYVAVIRQFFIISYHMSYFKLFQVIFLYFKVI